MDKKDLIEAIDSMAEVMGFSVEKTVSEESESEDSTTGSNSVVYLVVVRVDVQEFKEFEEIDQFCDGVKTYLFLRHGFNSFRIVSMRHLMKPGIMQVSFLMREFGG